MGHDFRLGDRHCPIVSMGRGFVARQRPQSELLPGTLGALRGRRVFGDATYASSIPLARALGIQPIDALRAD